jgi:uncharacterized protein YcbX
MAVVTELWRYPVKSMLGERLDEAEIGAHGIAGDRTFGLVDAQTGRVCSAKRHDLWGKLFTTRARFERPGRAVITFPDGTEHATDEPDISRVLSGFLGREVTLATTAPPNAWIEEIWDDSKGDKMYGPRTGEQADGNAIIHYPVASASPGDFFDVTPIHYITTNTLDEFARREPDSDFDVRRFRPNILIEVDGEEGFVENDWKVVRIGDVELQTVMVVPRCVMTTLAQDDLPRDPNVLRSTARHNRLDVGPLGLMPCAGIDATVSSGGTIRAGDTVEFVR